MIDPQDSHWMGEALKDARKAAALGEVPVGAVVVMEGEIVGRGHNLRESQNDPTAHAEMVAIREAASRLGRWRLGQCTLYVTLEPCPMCAGAIVNSRLDRIVFGASDQRAGAVRTVYQLCDDPKLNHRAEITFGVEMAVCSEILSSFFAKRRAEKQALREEGAGDSSELKSE
jgi:tRNA(adenine34) deaminase